MMPTRPEQGIFQQPAKATPRPLVFCATGIEEVVGGIASSNRNVRAALEELGEEVGAPVEILSLLETEYFTEHYRAYGGDKVAFTGAVLRAFRRAALVVFDHVHLAAPALLLPRMLRSPFAICAHGSEVGKRMRPVSRRVLFTADLILANSNYTLRNMRRKLGRPVGITCWLGLPPHFALTSTPPEMDEAELAREGLQLEAANGSVRPIGGRMMLLVGRLDAGEREKGHRELIDALPSLLAKMPEAQLVFVGSGSDEVAIRNLAAASPASAQIFVTGRAPQELLEQLYRAAYAYVMPSRQEGFGLVYLEAMNLAKPCLACRGDGGGEVVVNGETGLLVDQPIDTGQLVANLARLLKDPIAARQMGLAGWRRLNERFTAAAHQARLIEAIGPIVAGQKRQWPIVEVDRKEAFSRWG